MSRPDPEQFSRIFICYRRGDSTPYAGRIFDHLSAHFGEEQVFMDIDHILPGQDFVEVMKDAINACEVLLAVIGRQWLVSTDGVSRRLDNPQDFVRLEVTAALQRKIRIIPVLVGGATMPQAQDLPEELAPLALRQAVELSDLRWKHDMGRVVVALEKAIAERKEARLRAEQEEAEQRLQAAEEQRRLAEEARAMREAEELRQREEEEGRRQELEAEERRKREEAAARAAQEQKEREAEEERRREAEAQRAQELERKRLEAEAAERQRREADEAAREGREAEEQPRAPDDAAGPPTPPRAREPERQSLPEYRTPALPSAIIRFLLLAAVGSVVLVAVVITVWWPGARGGPASNPPALHVAGTPEVSPPQPAPAVPVAPEGMAFVPGGKFFMGRDDGTEYERSRHEVTVAPFFIDRYEVTRDEYQKFVKATGHPVPSGWDGVEFRAGTGRRPVTGVTWDDADAFCRKGGRRLPTEAEWEFAARGPDGRLYPWGNEWNGGAANVGHPEFSEQPEHGLENVDSRSEGRSPYGVFNMVGNVWEWTASSWAAYEGGKLPPEELSGDRRVIRGGSFDTSRDQATTTYRRGYRARGAGNNNYSKIGFRCVSNPPDSTTTP